MSTREIIPFVVAAIGGIGAAVAALIHMGMVDALNTRRPIEAQIPNPPVTWSEFKWFGKNPGFDYWSVLRKYREEFPDGKLRFWHTAGLVWMFSCFVVFVVLFRVLH
jgi:hypothetical protein